jgi:hypothetical protein
MSDRYWTWLRATVAIDMERKHHPSLDLRDGLGLAEDLLTYRSVECGSFPKVDRDPENLFEFVLQGNKIEQADLASGCRILEVDENVEVAVRRCVSADP